MSESLHLIFFNLLNAIHVIKINTTKPTIRVRRLYPLGFPSTTLYIEVTNILPKIPPAIAIIVPAMKYL